MFLLSRLSWEVLRIKFEEAKKIQKKKKKKKKKKKASKIYFVKVKSFLSSRISYLRCYFHDLFTNIRVKAAMLPIM